MSHTATTMPRRKFAVLSWAPAATMHRGGVTSQMRKIAVAETWLPVVAWRATWAMIAEM